ncbi:tRNA (adenosine(37)-N6)-threonylcarbamoyltransferase complex dimerization subunit type 1 TsaB [Desulfolutivibrio sulfoxidireducens]|uniref:tRNA (adenosine(37)-N6)-threonylcarbamoyltransferase complex dimerization subunit type 1 TsaB n=1 Tax=Desulfolutivibrio sulfoxidireducens TaxID=2773299 RepID=UPI00159D7B67|nr:tRNA (adenosine(37)-N6)-threonylcarbamoyltransferase complex dimerization subunit type 1 TsaB [Desulfolutivibrio sulfoxidireducens]QLA18721.1 tRNA (adenosine(37)-N6)-threonylcarbamoyltransferase complex dimerization subunit type 1 TsaB [Desulfolutivibrio sulfoxidireducens]
MTCNASSSDHPAAGPEAGAAVTPDSGPVLVVCAVEERLAVVLASQGQVMAAEGDQGQGLAMTFLAPAVARVLGRAGLSPQDLSGVACVRGPGSFTGIRVGLALCRGLCLGEGLPMSGLDYLPLVARGAALHDPGAGRVAVVVHARKGLVYFQTFEVKGRELPVAVESPRVLAAPRAASLAATLAADTGGGLFRVAGSGLRNNREVFAASLPLETLLPEAAAFPGPSALALAATGPSRERPVPAEPLYLRGSDAEKYLPTFAGERGLTLEEARAVLGAACSIPPS